MIDPQTHQTEEQWWEVMTSTGLILTLPAPLPTTDAARLLQDARSGRGPMYVTSHSQVTGRTYTLNLAQVLLLKQYPIKVDQDRHERSVARALGILSGSASDDGPDLASPSDTTASRGGRSTGGPTKRTILH